MAMEDEHQIIDMTLEGDFVSPSGSGSEKPPLGARLMLWAIIGTVLAIAALIVAVTFWFVVMILPLILFLALVGYLSWRYQIWRARHGVIWRGPPR